jgi:peptidoglycan/LPS O-acetylase OafA/YrhL
VHTSHHRADIEGLRAVAVVAVVLYHAGLGAASGGFVGVDAFFVISGFLITGLLWRELDATGRISLRTFYARRARRLLPASVLVIVATVIASARWLSPLQARDVGGDGVASALYVMNHRLAMADTSYLDVASPSPLQHYWSLAVEEQFYVVWPALVILAALAWRKRAASATSAAAALTASASCRSCCASGSRPVRSRGRSSRCRRARGSSSPAASSRSARDTCAH